MVNPITSGNGIIPITIAPPEDVAPTIPGYGMSLGVTELTEPGKSIPLELLGEGLVEYPVTFEFHEYALVLQEGVLVQVSLSGQTIDWGASEIDESGSMNVQFGVTTQYDLAGRSYSTYQYTYLDFHCVLVENGVEKTDSWTVRMKHY